MTSLVFYQGLGHLFNTVIKNPRVLKEINVHMIPAGHVLKYFPLLALVEITPI